jgi:capsular exopolysaccharide synthesis family protein
MPRPARDNAEFSVPFDPRALFWALREKVWLIAAILGASVLAGLFYLSRTERVYAATTTIEVEEEQSALLKTDGQRIEGATGDAILKTIEQNLSSPALRLRIGHHAELAGDPDFLADVERPISDARLQTLVGGKVSASTRAGTRLIDIAAEDAKPEIAQKLARIAVEEYIASTSDKRVQASRQAQELLGQEADRLKAALEKSEARLQLYKEQHRAVSLEEKQNIVVERLKELNQKVTEARAERLKLETDRAQLTQLADQPAERLLLLPTIAGAAEVVETQRRLTERNAEMATLSQRYKPEHPKFIEAQSALAELEAHRNDVIRRTADLAGTALEAATVTEKKLEDALRGQESIALELSQMAIPYQSLSREVESDRALFASLLARLKESDVVQSVSPHAIRVVAAATLPERPIRPSRLLVLLLSCGGGLALGLTAALGSHVFDRSLRTVDQAEQSLGMRSLAAIPLQPGAGLSTTRRLFLEKPHSALAESFRNLRTTLLVADRERGCRSVIFASAIPGEGKSFCATNYAAALAGQGLRTLLIDGDLRLPSIGPVFLGAASKVPGFADVLAGTCPIETALHVTDIENLSVLPAGHLAANPAELLGRSDVAAFLQTVLARFDRIVIDTAPVLAVSETLLLVPHVDAVCLVVRAARTPDAVVVRALEKLRESGARIPGFILNGLPIRGGYHYHYHAPGYGRDEVYGATSARRS